MTVALTPYLQFNGDAAQAMEFYHGVFGGELSMMTFAEGMGDTNPDTADQIMHASLYGGRGLHVMASDMPPGMPGVNGNISLSGDGTDPADVELLEQWWEGLLPGASILMPMEQAPWGDKFGHLSDKFGVSWMVNIPGSAA